MSSKEIEGLAENARTTTNEALECLKFGQTGRAKQLFEQASWLRWKQEDLLRKAEVDTAKVQPLVEGLREVA